MEKYIEKTILALKNNNMDAYYAENAFEAKEIVISLLEKGSSVATGGSMTLKELNIFDILRNGDYNFYDRYSTNDREQINNIYRQSFFADTYLCSSNAITENGELFNVDGTGNRVAAIIYGPKSVIIIVGKNKIVKNLDEAQKRVKTIAAPLNTKRLNKETFCEKSGICAALGDFEQMTDGCKSCQRICRDYCICGPQAEKGRIKIIIVNEDLGY